MNSTFEMFPENTATPPMVINTTISEEQLISLKKRKFNIRSISFIIPNTYIASVKCAQHLAGYTSQTWHVIEFKTKRYATASGEYLMSNPQKIFYTAFAG
jgi:hypothetical protein